ncbi:MAG TPA: flippase-like domain-containing protein [Firmicutes bacterium]|nr:flippase-like domain-containing protein [Bacillota bacterium]
MSSVNQAKLQKKTLPVLVKKGLALTATISLLTMVCLFLFSSSSDTTNTWKSLLSFRKEHLLLLMAITILSWLIEGLRIKMITKVLEEDIRLIDILRINLATLFSGNVTPFTSGGLPTQVYLLHQKGMSVGKATAVATIRITFSNLFFAIGGPLLLFFFRHQILNRLELTYLSGIINYILFLAAFFSLLLILFLWKPTKGGIIVHKFFQLTSIRRILGGKTDAICQRVLQELEEFHSCLTILRKNIPHMIMIISLTVLYWAAFFCIAPAVLMGYGVRIILGNVIQIVLLQFIIIFLISFLPIPGGSGLAEMGLYSVFAIYLPKHLLAIAVMIWRFISYHLNTLVGGVFFLRMLFSKEKKEADLPG